MYLATAEDPLSPSVLLEVKKAEAEGLKEAIQKVRNRLLTISSDVIIITEGVANRKGVLSTSRHSYAACHTAS